MYGALLVAGTTSDAGKSALVTGICRLLARRGVAVAPFKAQNMSNNSVVTPDGGEIGRAQAVQALACGLAPSVAFNPVLLKPGSDRSSQVVVRGRVDGLVSARSYQERKSALLEVVTDTLAELRTRYDVVVCEGAGSPAEINLRVNDIANMGLAHAADLPVIVVGDIDRGGVFASLYGTVALLPDHLRSSVAGFVINKFRGDPALLSTGLADLQARTGIPTLGVLPWVEGLHLDAEDSLALRHPWGDDAAGSNALDVCVVRFPRISNFTDIDALALEPDVSVRYVTHAAALGDPDLVILPGTKATVADLTWLRARGFEAALHALPSTTTLLGICGGYQMLARRIDDPVESAAGLVEALGMLPAETHFEPVKVTRPRVGTAVVPGGPGRPVTGYQIHHGRTTSTTPWITLEDTWGTGSDGAINDDGSVLGTSLHGLFECDEFRTAFLAAVAARRGKTFASSGLSFAGAREAQFDRLADLVETHLDMAAIEKLIGGALPVPASETT